MNNLSNFQFDVLKQFAGVRAVTESIIVRALRSDKAKVRHAVNSLLAAGMISQNGAYEFTLAPDGEIYLKQAGIETKPAKRKADPMEKLMALDLPPSKQTLQSLSEIAGEDVAPKFEQAMAGDLDQVSFSVRNSGVLKIEDGQAKFTPDPVTVVESTPEGSNKQRNAFSEGTGPGTRPAGQFHFPEPSGDWGKVDAVAALPAPDRADFATLVRQGMARLNAQLGLQPIAIENAALKVETLEFLAESIGATNEPHVYTLLRAIAQDIQRIAERSSK